MTVSQVAKRALLVGIAVTSIIAIVASTAGALVSELPGMLGALVGAGLGFAMKGLGAVASLGALGFGIGAFFTG